MPGAACSDISSIEEDSQGNLWVSTLYGLSKYDRATGRFTNYYEADGIGGNQFYDRASCHLADGTLAFGGTHGLTLFQPIGVPAERDVTVLFENLKVHNRLVRPGRDGCIDKLLSYNPDIRLKHDQNGFSISFLALDYGEHERVHYFYKLEGFDRYAECWFGRSYRDAPDIDGKVFFTTEVKVLGVYPADPFRSGV